MAGIFDFLGGGTAAPTPGLLDAAGYMDPAKYDAARRNQGMMGLWAGLLAGGGPSLDPRNFGSALGAGFTGMNQFGSKFDEDQLHAAKAAEARAGVGKLGREAELYGIVPGLIKEFMAGGGTPGSGSTGGASAAPGAGGDVPNFGAGSGGGGGWGPHAGTAIETLRAAGYSDAAIQGIMANGLGEGGFKSPWVKAGSGENSFGHWQFNARGELPGYLDFVKQQGGDPQDTRLQALYVAKRAEEVHPGFAKLDDPKLATDIFATKFERYQGAKPGQRYGLLTDAQRYMAGTPVEARQPIPEAPGQIAGVPNYSGALPGALAGGENAFRTGPPMPEVMAAGAAPVPSLLSRPGTDPNVISVPPPSPLNVSPAPAPMPPPINPRAVTFPPARETQSGSAIRIEPLAGEAVPVGDAAAAPAGQQFGVGGALSRATGLPIPAAMVAPAPAVPPAPDATQPPAVTAAPSPGATMPPGMPAAPTARAPVPMPGAIAAPPLSAAQAPAPMAGASSDQRVRAAQGLSLALSVLGKTVPGFIGDIAGLPVAGQKAALEAAARQPYLLQMEAYKQMGELQKTEYSHALGLDKSRLDSELARYNDLYGKGGVFNPQTGQVEPVPGMSETQAAAAGAKKAAEDTATRTQDQKEYDSYVKQETAAGRAPLSQFEYLQNLKRAGAASTVINTAEGLAAAQQKARLDIDTKAAKDAGEIAAAARRTAPLLDEVLRIAHSTPSGWAGPISLRMSQAFSAAGLPVTAGMSNAEVMRSMNQLLIPTVREPGSSSNADVNNYLAATPGLMNSPEGRVKMASMIKAMGSRAGEIAAIYRNNVGAADLHEKLAALDAKPLFTEQQRADIEQAAGGGVTKRNPDGSWTTPSGAIVREVR